MFSIGNGKFRDHKQKKIEQLDNIAERWSNCKKCKNLAACRTQTVFGVGSCFAKIVLVGEAPGKDEDKEGVPFIGRAGQLLDKWLVKCRVARHNLYITNIVICRPPENRIPTLTEILNCRSRLCETLEVLDPQLIVAIGSTALQSFLGACGRHKIPSIMSASGKFFSVPDLAFKKSIPNAKIMGLVHPAYILRNMDQEEKFGADVGKLAFVYHNVR